MKEFPGAVMLVSHDRHFLKEPNLSNNPKPIFSCPNLIFLVSKGVATEYWALKPGGGFKITDDFDNAKEFSYGKLVGV